MTDLEAVERRISRRSYLETPLDDQGHREEIHMLREEIKKGR